MATKIIILGANGAIAQHAIEFLKDNPHFELTLFARKTNNLKAYTSFAKIIEGDVANPDQLHQALKGQDVVYANLSGAVDKLAQNIVDGMKTNNVKRLIFITSLGIYKEVAGKFGEWNERMIGRELIPYRKAADIIEATDLDYTIVRPSWLTDNAETTYETTQKGEPFTGTEVARKAVARYIVDILESGKDIRASVGVQKPNSQGDKPSFY